MDKNPPKKKLINLLEYYQKGLYGDAGKLAMSLTRDYPGHYFGWKILGAILKQIGKKTEAINANQNAIKLFPEDPEIHNNLGLTLQELGRLDEAETSLRQAINLKPDLADAHGNMGILMNAKGLKKSALEYFEKKLQLERGLNPNINHKSFVNISKVKIDHDIEQFEYLVDSGYEIKKFKELIKIYKTVSSEIDCVLDTDIIPISKKHSNILANSYNRPIHILEAPALAKTPIDQDLNVGEITNNYFNHEFGLTYIDNFLTPNALKSLREFVLGSTIWFDFFHEGGYMGAYLSDGLASPLILQIAEDLRNKFPKIFKNHHLNQLWAYKYDSRSREKNNNFSGINVHADFAAINVNFWITPTSANLDSSSGGLIVYNTEAPKNWHFNEYNKNQEKIYEEILKSDQKKTVIPYNENRAVIFNSNLFHETDKIEFKEGYQNRRINITMLFGYR